VTRDFSLTPDGKRQIQWIGEVFNIFNHTNFRTINNVVGTAPAASLQGNVYGSRVPVTQPLAFTSANDPRQFQLGLKVFF
jgi:hypothetical protein